MGKPVRGSLRPETSHGLAALVLALLLTALPFLLFPVGLSWPHLLAAWLVGVNLTTFGYYGYDKAQARSSARRVPEVVLHGLAFAGGSPAAWLAMRLFRHKTVKGRFRLVFWAIIVLQVGLICWIGYAVWTRR
jgi:uncharacterized membrane protein YsdA (DUF1294 family)